MGNLDFGNFGTIFQGSEEQLFPSFGTINREAPRAPRRVVLPELNPRPDVTYFQLPRDAEVYAWRNPVASAVPSKRQSYWPEP